MNLLFSNGNETFSKQNQTYKSLHTIVVQVFIWITIQLYLEFMINAI